MRRSSRSLPWVALAIVFGLVPQTAFSNQFYNSSGRADFIDNGQAFKARDAPDLVVWTKIPGVFDPSSESLSVVCFLQARKSDGFSLISKVKARYTAEIVVVDTASGTVAARRIHSGKYKTGNPGTAFHMSIDTADFADGFPESTLAFVQTTFRMTNKKPASGLTAICETSIRMSP